MIRIANLTRLEFVPKCSFKLPLLYRGEKITAGHYSENGYNFLVGTNFANLYICSLVIKGKKAELTCCNIENVGKVNRGESDAPAKDKFKTHQKVASASGMVGEDVFGKQILDEDLELE